MPLTNAQILARCATAIKQDSATIEVLRKQVATAARDAEIHSRVAKAAVAQAAGPTAFSDGIAQYRAGQTVSRINPAAPLTRVVKAAKKDKAPAPGAALAQHLNDAADALKTNEGLSEAHPAVQALRQAAYNYQDPDAADGDDPGEAAAGDDAMTKAARALIRATRLQKDSTTGEGTEPGDTFDAEMDARISALIAAVEGNSKNVDPAVLDALRAALAAHQAPVQKSAAVSRIRTDQNAGRFGPIRPGRTGSTRRVIDGGQ